MRAVYEAVVRTGWPSRHGIWRTPRFGATRLDATRRLTSEAARMLP